METLTVKDFIDIIKSGDTNKNHEELERQIDRLSDKDKKTLIIKMTYVLDALLRN